jgi:hypothetical protein
MKEKTVKVEKAKTATKTRKKKKPTVHPTEVRLWVNSTDGSIKRMRVPNRLTSAFIRDFGVLRIPEENNLAAWLRERDVEDFY